VAKVILTLFGQQMLDIDQILTHLQQGLLLQLQGKDGKKK
jgi:hypothetical protein